MAGMGTTEGHAEGARPAWTSRPPFPPTKTNGVLPGTDNASQPTRFPPLSRPYFLSAPEASDFPSALEPPPIPVLPSELDGNIAGSSLDPAFVQHKKRPAKSAHSRQISYGWQVCLRLWASPTLVCKRIICQLRSWLAEPYAESTELITRQLLRQRTDGYARIVKMGFAVFGLLFAMAVHRRGLQWTTGLILGIAWFWTCVAVAPPGPHGDWRLRLWRPQVISILLIFLYSLLTKHVRTPTPPGFSFEPICMAFVDFAVQLVLAKRDFMLLDRFLTGFLIIAIHVVASPIVSLGWRQQVLSVGANTLGFSFGIAIRTDEQQLRAMIEEVETEHRAMLRLHHVIQGQCEGAAALVRAIRETEGEKGVSEATSSLISDIEGMLDEAASWCACPLAFPAIRCACALLFKDSHCARIAAQAVRVWVATRLAKFAASALGRWVRCCAQHCAITLRRFAPIAPALLRRPLICAKVPLTRSLPKAGRRHVCVANAPRAAARNAQLSCGCHGRRGGSRLRGCRPHARPTPRARGASKRRTPFEPGDADQNRGGASE